MSESEPKPSEIIQIQLEWQSADALPTIHSNQASVSHAGMQDFYIIFGEAHAPTDAAPTDGPRKVPIRAVAKIAMSPASMLNFAQAVAKNVQGFLEKQPRPDKGDDDAARSD